jgi:hypothetical protein
MPKVSSACQKGWLLSMKLFSSMIIHISSLLPKHGLPMKYQTLYFFAMTATKFFEETDQTEPAEVLLFL